MLLARLFTKNLKSIPLLIVNFNYQHYKKEGKNKSCMISLHPNLKDDEFIETTINTLIDYIRDNYDMKTII